jgi:ABC-2 type transport system ATP-binding protein
MGTVAITVAHLRKTYGDVVAVEDLTLTVPQGSLFGFLGPNGAGKTTTIGCLTGLLDPTSGNIFVLGRPMHADALDLKRRIGVLPQSLALFDGLYAHEFLAFQARMFGLDEPTTRHRVAELLEALDLTGEGRKPLADFSEGMKKRVALAAAIVHRPEVLFLDEPFASIDPAGSAMIKGWLRKIVDQGRTVFITSHVLETIETLCDRVAIVTQPGRLQWEGSLSDLQRGRQVVVDGCEFSTLEALFLHLTGRRDVRLDWL